MKKIIAVIAVIMIFSLSGCKDNNVTEQPTPTPTATVIPDIDPSTVDAISEKWVMHETVFYAENTYSRPFYDVKLDVEYTSPSGKKYTVPAFWDGDNIWRVRFAPTEEGVWTYKTAGSSDAGLNKSGTLGCNTYKGDLDIYKHGFIKPTGRYFSYDDGTPFFYLGDTHWTMLKEEIDSAGPNTGSVNTDSHFKYIVDKRVEQGFTVYQSEPIEAKYKYSLSNGFDKNDLRGFQKADEYFAYIAQKGLVHANSQLFFTEELATNYSLYSTEYLKQLTRYWVARYGAYPVMWTTAQEADDDFFAGSVHTAFTKENNPWKTITAALNEYDPYNHPLSCHTEGGVTADKSAFTNIEGYSWFAAQTYVKRLWPQDYTNFIKNYDNFSGPIVLYEGHYENLWTTEFGARVQGYAAFLNGMCGYGYGVGDIWYYKSSYDMDKDTVQEETIKKEDKQVKWGDVVENANSKKLGYLKNFFTAFNWYDLKPCFGKEEFFTVNDKNTFTIGSTIGVDRTVIYVYNRNNSADITVKTLDSSYTYTARWFDANTGEYVIIEDNISGKSEYSVKNKPSDTDYVLEIYKK